MTGSKDTDPLKAQRTQGDPSEKSTKSAKSKKKVSALLVGVDDEIEQMRQRMLQILTDEPSPEIPVTSGQFLEELVLDLRQANEHLVIASLDANTRETKTAETHRRQTLFLSMLAHELRNPLAPIAMSIELLGKIPETSPAIQSLQRILARQTSHLTRLVEDLMDATRINSGKIKIQKTNILLSQLMAQAVETSQPLLNAHDQSIQLDIPLEPLWIHGDLIRLSQLFSNLILNASKFSADLKTVKIVVRHEGGNAIISVKDQGIGISLELQPFVFDLFVQGPVGEGLMASGLGIGLSLVRTIAQLHGGTVSLVSQGVGRGSEFIVTLPVTAGVVPRVNGPASLIRHPPKPLRLPLKRKNILLIDDNADINQTLSAFLVEAGHEVDCALDGATGLRMESLHHHDVICCDIGLPGMNGYEVAKNLIQSTSTARLIAISGYDQPAQKDQAFKAGFDHYLVKPIFGNELLELIASTSQAPR